MARIPISGWMIINYMPCFDHTAYLDAECYVMTFFVGECVCVLDSTNFMYMSICFIYSERNVTLMESDLI